MENILVIRLKAIGDVIFTLPAIGALREKHPDARISFLASTENAQLLRGFREVNQVIALNRAALKKGNPFAMTREFLRLLLRLRAGHFSLVVDFQGFGETAWMTWLTGAPDRWGSVYGRGRRWAYTLGLRRNELVHPADWNLQLLAGCGVPCPTVRNEFFLPDDAVAAARDFLKQNTLDPDRPTLVIQPFTSSAQKNWPLENFLAVARHCQARGVQVVFVGGPNDQLRLEPARAARFCVAAGLPLLVSAGLVQLSTLLLGGDTGLGHLAVAQGRQVRLLMMHKSPGAAVPFQHPEWAVVPERSSYVRDIPLEAVLAATDDALGSANVGSAKP